MQVAWDKEAINVATRLHFLLTSIPRKLAVVGCALIVVQGLASSACGEAAPAKKGGAVPSAPPLGAKAPSTTPARPTAPAKSAPPPAADSAARDQILNSAQWQETIQDFEAWLAGQTLYDAQQAKQIKARLEVGISRMNASQLQWFETDMQAKLKVLSSDQAREAEAYLRADSGSRLADVRPQAAPEASRRADRHRLADRSAIGGLFGQA